MKQPSRGRVPKKHVILFVAANPLETDRMALDREARAIQLELKRSGYRDRFEFVTWGATEPLDLLRLLREQTPTIVHFSGHGAAPARNGQRTRGRDVVAEVASDESAPGGVVFVGVDGRSQVVTPTAFSQTLAAAGASVRLVMLNACFTTPMAQVIAAHVECVVGMTGAIHDDAARIFSIGFYGALGDRASVAAAFAHGMAAINLEGLNDLDQPHLVVRDGFDAAQLVLAAEEPSRRVDVPCPYPGMRPFAADDADHFYGREREIAELIGRLRAGEREIFVIGPSGSGKSSLVTAGVLPRLASGVSGLGPCVVRELRPGERPTIRLGEALDVSEGGSQVLSDRVTALLAHRGPGALLMVVVDQLEELFTLANGAERASFLEALIALRAEHRCAVVFTLRADFFGALMESELWADRRGRLSRIEVSPLRGEALCEAIAEPARAVGVRVEPELVVRLVADAASEPGILPLMQETMVHLWDARVDQTLTLADYQGLGDGERSGLSVALARRAEASMRQLSPKQTTIARRVLLRLISFGEGRSDTRRQQSCAQLRSAGDDAEAFALVLQAMVEDRLLTVDDDVAGEPRIDLSHEALITAWPELRRWIDERRADEQRRRRLEAKAGDWIEHGRGTASLLDDVELAEATQWMASDAARDLGQPAEFAELVTASRRAIEELARQRRQRARRTVTALAVGLTVVSTLAVVAWVQRQAAQESSIESRRQARTAQEKSAEAQQQTREVHRRLADSYLEQGRGLLIDHAPSQPMWALPYLLAAREERGQAGDDIDPVLRILFARAADAAPRVRVAHQGTVVAAAFSPDGVRVVTASTDGTARVWDAHTGKPLTELLAYHGGVVAAAFSPDGARVVTASADSTARVWDARTGKPVIGPLVHRGAVYRVAFSPDGARIVTASEDRTARVWDARTGKPVTSPLAHHGGVLVGAFSPDGAYVVTASRDRTARVWDARTGKPLTEPLAHHGYVHAAAFSPDGMRVVTASDDSTARVWDARTGKPVIGPLVHQGAVYAAAFSPDGARVVTASLDRTARLWDARTGKPVTEPLLHQGWVNAAVFSPDSTRVVTASLDKTARVWDARTGKPLTEILADHGWIVTAAFSPDGTRVVTANGNGTARVWDARTGKPLTEPLPHQRPVEAAAFSPDGARVVTASNDRTARVWDARTGKPLTEPLPHQGDVLAAAFSPDGTRMVTSSLDGTARIWDARTGKPLTGPLAHQSAVYTAAFSPDGTRVVTASLDRTARVWDARTGKPLTEPLPHLDSVRTAAFSPDGTRVLTASFDRRARMWDLPLDRGSLEDWKRRARCGVFKLEDGILVDNHSPCP